MTTRRSVPLTRAMKRTILIVRRRMKRWLRIATTRSRSLSAIRSLTRSGRLTKVELITRILTSGYLKGSRVTPMKRAMIICIDNDLLN